MEEEKKEEECCEVKNFHKHFHHCCGHKIARAVLLGAIIFVIFSVGVCVGSHRNSNRELRGSKQFNFEQRSGSRMMRGYNVNMMQDQNGGRHLQGQVNQGQFQGQIEVQSQVPTQVKTVTPAK